MKPFDPTSRKSSSSVARMAAIALAGGLSLCTPWLAVAESAPDAGSQATTVAPVTVSGKAWQRHAQRHHGGWGHGKAGCAAGPGARGVHGPAGMHGAMRGDQHWRGLTGELALSQEQRDRIFAIRHAAEPQLREQAKKLRDLRVEFRQAVQADTWDEAGVRSLAAQQGQAIADLMQMRARQMHEIQAVLTPAQKEKLQQPRQQRQRPAPRSQG